VSKIYFSEANEMDIQHNTSLVAGTNVELCALNGDISLNMDFKEVLK
jgi:hypothetical protein